MIKNILKYLLKFIYFNLKILYVILIIPIIVIICVSFSKDSSKISKSYSYVTLSLNDISDDKYNNTGFFKDKTYTFSNVIEKVDKLRLNKNLKGIILNLDDLDITPSQTEELGKILDKYPMSKKKIYAYGSNINKNNYKLASYADEIVMPNTLNARLSINGYYANNLYFKDIFDKFGVNVQAIHVGTHKSYGENFYSNKMSSELKEDSTRILDNRLDKFISTVSKNRKIDENILSKNILEGKYDLISPYTAKDYGLIDNIQDFDDFLDSIQSNDDNTISITDLLKEKSTYKSQNIIAILPLEGPISSGKNSINFSISEDSVRNKLDQISNNKNIKAVILRINSPGGDALEAEMIHKLITKFSKKYNIPIYASLSDVAASGGYYIATSAKKIYANDATITGSIGVVSLMPKFTDTLNKFSVNNEVISKGKFTGIFNPYYKLTDEDKNHILNTLNDVYAEFKHRVSTARNITDDKLEPIAGGRIWLGDEAKKLGLVDGIASLDEVIDIVAKDCNLSEYSLLEVNSALDIDSISKYIQSYIFKNSAIQVYDEAYKKLLFLNENSCKALFFDDEMSKIEF